MSRPISGVQCCLVLSRLLKYAIYLTLFCSASNALWVYCWPLESCCAQCSDGFQDELARVLVTLFDSRHLLYQLLWNMFSKEVELADSMQTLFRGNSLASKIMTFCFKVK